MDFEAAKITTHEVMATGYELARQQVRRAGEHLLQCAQVTLVTRRIAQEQAQQAIAESEE